jgi:hypothetical protein
VWFRLNGTENNLISTSNLPLSKWVNVVCIKDGATIAMYFDAVAVGTLGGQPDINISTGSLTLGAYPDGSFPINARFDDIRIYNRAISATEVSLLSKERGIGFKRSSSAFAKRYAYKPPKDKTYAAITRSQSDYDSLREGLVLAICPSVSGATGYRAVDVSGRGNHGSLVNMDAASDWVASNGMALDFDGSDDYVLLPSVNLPKITMSLWVYFTTDVSHVFLAKRDATDYSWEIGRNAGNDQLLVRINSNTNVATGGNLPINTWLHVAGTYDNSTIRAYINGVLVNEVVYSTAISVNVTALTLGARALFAGAESFFPLKIDDARIYNRALTPPEIRQLASRRGIGLQPTPRHTDYIETREKTYSVIVKSQQEHSSLSEGCVGAWCPSLGASGYRLIDRSGYGNHGVLTGMDAATDWVASNGVALDFENLSDDRVSCSSANISMAEGAISLFCRKVAATADDNDYMLWMHFTSVTDRLYLEIQTYLIGGNKNAKFLATFNNNVSNYAVGTTINLNQWYHALVQWKNGFPIEIYIDGRFVSSSSTNYTTNATTTSEFIGNDHANLVGFGGYIDDFRRYTRRLTPSEIRLLASKRGIGLRSQKQTMFYQFPSGSKRRRILTGMP